MNVADPGKSSDDTRSVGVSQTSFGVALNVQFPVEFPVGIVFFGKILEILFHIKAVHGSPILKE